MTKPFDMALFLSGVLTGSEVTQQRHLRQARIMQAAILLRWKRDNLWTWQLKHVRWFLTQHLRDHSNATKYYYRLTVMLIWNRMGKVQNAGGALRGIEPGPVGCYKEPNQRQLQSLQKTTHEVFCAPYTGNVNTFWRMGKS